jgi:hypothetical protein
VQEKAEQGETTTEWYFRTSNAKCYAFIKGLNSNKAIIKTCLEYKLITDNKLDDNAISKFLEANKNNSTLIKTTSVEATTLANQSQFVERNKKTSIHLGIDNIEQDSKVIGQYEEETQTIKGKPFRKLTIMLPNKEVIADVVFEFMNATTFTINTYLKNGKNLVEVTVPFTDSTTHINKTREMIVWYLIENGYL